MNPTAPLARSGFNSSTESNRLVASFSIINASAVIMRASKPSLAGGSFLAGSLS